MPSFERPARAPATRISARPRFNSASLIGVVAAVVLWAAAPLLSSLTGEPALTRPLRPAVLGHPALHDGDGAPVAAGRLGRLSRARRAARGPVGSAGSSSSSRSSRSAGPSRASSSAPGGVGGRSGRRPDLDAPAGPRRVGKIWRALVADALPFLALSITLRLFDRIDLLPFKVLGGTTAQAGLLRRRAEPGLGAVDCVGGIPSAAARDADALCMPPARRAWRPGSRASRCAWSAGVPPIAGLAAGAGTPLASWLFGSAFADTGSLLGPLLLGGVAQVLMAVVIMTLTAAGHPNAFVRTGVGMVVLATVFGLFAIPIFGAMGAAAATSATGCLGAASGLWLAHRLAGVPIPIASFARAGAAAVAAALACHASLSLLPLFGALAARRAGRARGAGTVGRAGWPLSFAPRSACSMPATQARRLETPDERPARRLRCRADARPAGALKRCLESLSRQDYPTDAFEIVVIDDGSPQPVTLPELGSGASLTLHRQAQGGPPRRATMGWSMRAASMWRSSTTTARHRQTGCVSWSALCSSIRAPASEALSSTTWPATRFPRPARRWSRSSASYYNANPEDARFFTSNNLAFPRAALMEAGGFDAQYQRAAAEDRELCDRWRRQGRRLVTAPDALVRHSHNLTLPGFWRQHFSYGTGAWHYWQHRANGQSSRVKVEPLGFYGSLLTWPVRTRGVAGLPVGALLALAQVANAAGFFSEAMRRRLISRWWSERQTHAELKRARITDRRDPVERRHGTRRIRTRAPGVVPGQVVDAIADVEGFDEPVELHRRLPMRNVRLTRRFNVKKSLPVPRSAG